MEKYQLSFFEKLIRQDIKQNAEKYPQPDQVLYISNIAKVREEKERILDSFSKDVFYLNDEKEIEWRVKKHQQKIILLAETAAEQLSREDILNVHTITQDHTWTNLYKVIYSSLIELLTFIETECTPYLDQYSRVPASYLLPARETFTHAASILKEKLTAANIHEQLLTIILQPFQEFQIKEDPAYFTYYRLSYLKALKDQLLDLVSTAAGNSDLNQQVQALLLELNFNSPQYYNYCTASIKKEVEALTLKEQLERLTWTQKLINQQQPKSWYIYTPLHSGLQQQLQRWLIEEINYLKEIYQLSQVNPTSDELQRWKNFKVFTQFSVSQLGNFIRLLVDTGIFSNQNKTELLEFCSHFFASTQQDNISPGSLRKNFYTEDASVSDGVRTILIQLLNHSKKG